MQLVKHINFAAAANWAKRFHTQWLGFWDLHHLLVTKDIELRELNAAIHLHRGVSLVPSISASRRFRVTLQRVQRITKASEWLIKLKLKGKLTWGQTWCSQSSLSPQCKPEQVINFLTNKGSFGHRYLIPLPLSPNCWMTITMSSYLTEERICEEIKGCLQKVLFGFVWKDFLSWTMKIKILPGKLQCLDFETCLTWVSIGKVFRKYVTWVSLGKYQEVFEKCLTWVSIGKVFRKYVIWVSLGKY